GWRFDAAGECRFDHRALGADLVRLALALGHRDVAAEVASTVAAGVALAPEVPTVRSLALRCQGLVDGEAEPMIEAVALARRAPLLVEHAGACEDAAGLLGPRRGGGPGGGPAGVGPGPGGAGRGRGPGRPAPGPAAGPP